MNKATLVVMKSGEEYLVRDQDFIPLIDSSMMDFARRYLQAQVASGQIKDENKSEQQIQVPIVHTGIYLTFFKTINGTEFYYPFSDVKYWCLVSYEKKDDGYNVWGDNARKRNFKKTIPFHL